MSPGIYCIIHLSELCVFQPLSPLYSIHPLRVEESPQYSSTLTTRSAKNRVGKKLNRRKKCRIKLVNRPNTPPPPTLTPLLLLTFDLQIMSQGWSPEKRGGGIEMLLGRISRAKIMSALLTFLPVKNWQILQSNLVPHCLLL
jgi:hypothetical protein